MTEALVNKLKSFFAYVVIALALFGGYHVYKYIFPSVNIDQNTIIDSIKPDATLVTSYAFVGVAYYKKNDTVVNDLYFEIDKPQGYDFKYKKFTLNNKDPKDNEIDGVCYKLYNVTFGYKDFFLSKEKNSTISTPEIIGIEPYESNRAGKFGSFECDSYDENVTNRKNMITFRMLQDGLYKEHLQAGCSVLSTLFVDQAVVDKCQKSVETELSNLDTRYTTYIETNFLKKNKKKSLFKNLTLGIKLKQKNIPNNYSGGVSSLMVSFSTLSLASRERFWILKDHFYFRRDKTQVFYGCNIDHLNKHQTNKDTTLQVYAYQPSELYRNSNILNMQKNYESVDEKLESVMDKRVREDVTRALNDYKRQIVYKTKSTFKENMQRFAKDNNMDLEFIKFVKE